MKKIFIACLCFITLHSSAQLKIPAPSSTQNIKQDFGLSSVEVNYSRPNMKGRKIFGDLVPFGKLWRTGANSATRIKFGDDVSIGGQALKAGEYALYTIPDANEWEIILNKGIDNDGAFNYKAEDDVLRFKIKPQTVPSSVETFTIDLANVKSSTADLLLAWDKTLVSIPLSANIDSAIMGQIDNAMNKDNHPYYQSAFYYAENGKDLNQAIKWFDKAIEQNPDAYYMYYQKARTLVKLGKKEEAKAVAQKSIELAKAQKNDDYVQLNEKLIAGLK